MKVDEMTKDHIEPIYASFTVLTRNDSSSVMFLCAECMIIIRY